MFLLSRQENVALRAIAMLLVAALVLMGIGLATKVDAANLTSVSDTLSDSDPSALSDHTILFTIPVGSNGIDAASETIVVTFPAGFDISNLALADIDLEVEGSDHTVVIGAAGANQWQVATSGQNLTFTSGGGTATATATDIVTVKLGTVADGGLNQVTNTGATGSHQLVISVASDQDTGKTEIAIVDNVLVTADVDTVFNFTVNGFADPGTDANGTTTNATGTATTIPFGTLTAGNIVTIAQRLNVETNAIQGFTVTVEQDANLLSTTNADIDGFADGSYQNTPSDWAAPSPNVALENTWGHWGLTSTDDINGSEFQGCAGFATGCWVAASTTPRDIFHHNGPTTVDENDKGSTTIAYQVEITALQEAADDYQTTLTYIATPIF